MTYMFTIPPDLKGSLMETSSSRLIFLPRAREALKYGKPFIT